MNTKNEACNASSVPDPTATEALMAVMREKRRECIAEMLKVATRYGFFVKSSISIVPFAGKEVDS